jgi:galactokinase
LSPGTDQNPPAIAWPAMPDKRGAGPLVPAREAAECFTDLMGRPPEGLWRAPGRVNLIGEHTDYNAGLALPFAIDRATVVAAARRTDRLVRIHSTTLDEQVTANLEEVADWDPQRFSGWSRYALGVAWAMSGASLDHPGLDHPGLDHPGLDHPSLDLPGIDLAHLDIPGLDVVISSDVPLRSGLSSSAALTVAVAVAINDLCGTDLEIRHIARVAQHAEAAFAGAPCGLLDQLAALEGTDGAGVLIDFLSLDTELVPLEIGPLVVLNTRVEHANAGGAYADRRLACETAAARLGVASLRQATLEQIEVELDGELRRRARHVVTENERVREAVLRLRSGAPVGDLLVGSHYSLRDDFDVSCPELDLAVGTALANGATGARLTGAGLGGCAIALGTEAEVLADPLAKAFAASGFRPPEIFGVAPSKGAERVA